MITREKCVNMLDTVPEYKLGYIFAFIQGLIADEEEDDAFCEQLYQEYLADPDNEETGYGTCSRQ